MCKGEPSACWKWKRWENTVFLWRKRPLKSKVKGGREQSLVTLSPVYKAVQYLDSSLPPVPLHIWLLVRTVFNHRAMTVELSVIFTLAQSRISGQHSTGYSWLTSSTLCLIYLFPWRAQDIFDSWNVVNLHRSTLTDTSLRCTRSGMEQPFVFSCCVTLLCPLCFHCCQEGSVIKFPFLCLFLCLTVSAAGWLVSSCCWGGLWAHRRLFYVRLQEGQIQNQWGNSSAALNSISAKQDPLRGAGISEAPKGRIVNMTDRGKRRDERKRREKSCYSCEMWNAQV